MHRVYVSLTWQNSKLASWGYILHLHTRAILWLQVTSGKKTNLVKIGRVRSDCYSSLCVCYHASCFIPPRLHIENTVLLSFLWRSQDMYCVDFVEIACSKVLAILADHLPSLL